nr:MAG: ORF1 [TTV-like mini virus]
MPYYWNRWRYRKGYYPRRQLWWPRRRFGRRRYRKTFRKRWPIYRRRRWVRNRKYYKKKKLKWLLIKQFQPQQIRKAKIKGMICLFQCGPRRLHYNWTQYMQTMTPEYWEGGGGWSQLKFSLGSLYQQHEFMHNIWTYSNVQLPLCRYKGCMFKFYRTDKIDYIVNYEICLPMLDNVEKHAMAQPFNMLKSRHKILVKSKRTKPNGKLFKKKFIRPPEQLQNSWYFQSELCNEGLVMITATAIDLDRFYLNPESVSNSITLTCINPAVFTNHNFQQSQLGTTVWKPNANWYLYGSRNGAQTVGDLSYLGQTKTREPGKPMKLFENKWDEIKKNTNVNWGNPFFYQYLGDNYQIYTSTKSLDESKSELNKPLKNNANYSLITMPLLVKVRYTPGKDTGVGNIVYLIRNTDPNTGWDPDRDIDLQFSGYPLWTLFWGWTDWQRKLKKATRIETDWLVCFRSPFLDKKLTVYCPLDDSYIHGNSPYQTEHFSESDWDQWYPSERWQMVSIESICKTGPGVAKTTTQSIEAHCSYCFYFNFGGCPKQLPNVTDPCQQPHYPVPHSELQGPETQDPEIPPQTETWEFDFRRDTLTQAAAKRLKKDFTTPTLLSTDGNKLQSTPALQTQQTLEKEDEASTSEEETTTLQQQLINLRKRRHQLKRRINQLISHTPVLKY